MLYYDGKHCYQSDFFSIFEAASFCSKTQPEWAILMRISTGFIAGRFFKGKEFSIIGDFQDEEKND